METLNLHKESEHEDSNTKDSLMTVFNEEILENEISQADAKPRHTPWTLIELVVGGGLLVIVVVVVLVGLVWCKCNRRNNYHTYKVEEGLEGRFGYGGGQDIDITNF